MDLLSVSYKHQLPAEGAIPGIKMVEGYLTPDFHKRLSGLCRLYGTPRLTAAAVDQEPQIYTVFFMALIVMELKPLNESLFLNVSPKISTRRAL